jgi:hypothetical protein
MPLASIMYMVERSRRNAFRRITKKFWPADRWPRWPCTRTRWTRPAGTGWGPRRAWWRHRTAGINFINQSRPPLERIRVARSHPDRVVVFEGLFYIGTKQACFLFVFKTSLLFISLQSARWKLSHEIAISIYEFKKDRQIRSTQKDWHRSATKDQQ